MLQKRKNQNLSDKEHLILSVIVGRRRGFTAQEVAEELEKYKVKMSRPTVAKHLTNLVKKGWLEEEDAKKKEI